MGCWDRQAGELAEFREVQEVLRGGEGVDQLMAGEVVHQVTFDELVK